MEPKWLQKSIKKSMQVLIRKISILLAKMVPTWSQNGDQNPGIPRTLRANLPRRLQGGQMEAKNLENGAKMEPKGSQMERKWSSKRSNIDKKSMKNEAVECDGELSLGMASTRFCDGFPLDTKSMLLRFSIDFHRISNGQSSCRSGRDCLACV